MINEELLIITMEECGELVQACSKMIRTKGRMLEEFQDEVGDVLCMIHLIQEADLVTDQQLLEREQVKLQKLKKWSSLV